MALQTQVNMELKQVLEWWKSIVGSLVVIVGATVAVLAWAADQEEAAEQKALEERAIVTATQQLIHNDMYQSGRIDRKRDQIREDKRELENIEAKVGDDEPTPRQARNIKELDTSIDRLKKDIEEIEVKLKLEDE